MLYTIGHKETYDALFSQETQPLALGTRQGFPGQLIWLRRGLAVAHVLRNLPRLAGYEVYGVECEVSHTADFGEGWRRLLVSSPLVKLVR